MCVYRWGTYILLTLFVMSYLRELKLFCGVSHVKQMQMGQFGQL